MLKSGKILDTNKIGWIFPKFCSRSFARSIA